MKFKLLFSIVVLIAFFCPKKFCLASSKSKSNISEIIIWHTFNIAQADILKNSLKAFEKESGLTIRLETGMPMNTALLKKKKNAQFPDALISPSDVINFNPTIPFLLLDDSWFTKDTTKLIEGKKNQYGIPLILGNHLMLFYNKTLVEDPIESWEELIKQAPALSKANLIPIVFDYREPFFLVPFFVHYLSQSKLRNEQEKKVVAMSSALKFYRSLVDNGVTPSDCSFTCVEQFFLAGKSTYAILGDWALLEMNSKLGSKLGIKSLPWLEGRPVPSLRMPITLSFPVSNRQVNLLPQLKALAHFLQAEAAQKKFASEGFRLVSNKHVRSDVTVNSKGAMEKVWGLYQQAQPVPDYINPLFWSSLGRALNLHVDGSLDSNQASELIFSMTNNQMHLEIYQ